MTQKASILIIHARAFTADSERPWAQAVAVQGRRIAFVGSDEDARVWLGLDTRLVDAQGGMLMPGFVDCHFHLLSGSLNLPDISLEPARDEESLAVTIREYAQQHPDHSWLIGHGMCYDVLGKGRPLTRQVLDGIVPDRPMILFAYDAHTAWANTAALQRAELLRGSAPGPNSEIVMASDGLASGELREPGAYNPIRRLFPPPDTVQKRALLHQGLAQAARHGVTSVHNMDGDADKLALYASLDDSGELTLRIYCPYDVTPRTPPEALAEAAAQCEAHRGEMVRSGCVKFFMDGVIESYTALLLDDCADRPGWRGDANYSAEHFSRMAIEADRLGLQIFVHAIGDAAVRRSLDGFEAARRANGPRDSRHRVEHIELIHPADLPRFKDLGVIASMQPLHAPLTADDPHGPWPARVGPRRWGRSFDWQGLRQAGADLVFGSDWPVVSQVPMLGTFQALNRRPWAPGLPEQRQALADVLAAYTRVAAYAEFQEQVKGQLRCGMLADMVLLSEDLFAVPAAEIDRVRVRMTMVDGRVVYED